MDFTCVFDEVESDVNDFRNGRKCMIQPMGFCAYFMKTTVARAAPFPTAVTLKMLLDVNET